MSNSSPEITNILPSFPKAPGIIENVLDIPSAAYLNGIFETDDNELTAPEASLPCIGLAPGANGWPAFLPSGVVPVFLPYITFDVIVKIEVVTWESR